MKIDLTRIKERDQLIRFLQVDEADFQIVLSFDSAAKSTERVSDDQIVISDIPVFSDTTFQSVTGKEDIARFGNRAST